MITDTTSQSHGDDFVKYRDSSSTTFDYHYQIVQLHSPRFTLCGGTNYNPLQGRYTTRRPDSLNNPGLGHGHGLRDLIPT